MPVQSKHTVLLAIARGLFDTVCILVAYLAAVFLTLPSGVTFSGHFLGHFAYLAVLVVVWCTAAIDQRLFLSRRSDALLPQLFAATKAVFLSLLYSVFLMALFMRGGLERPFLLVFGLCMLLSILVFKLTARLSLWDLRRRGYNFRRILIVGTNERAAHLVEVIQSHEHYGYQIEGFLEDDPERVPLLAKYGISYLGKIQALEDILVERVIDSVYISLPVRSFYETIQNIAHLCEGVGVPVRLVADLFPLRVATSDLTRLKDVPLLSLSAIPEIRTQFALRRATDLVVSAILLVLLSPVFLIIALIIKLDSKGPVFAFEERAGWDNRRVKLVKFRTLRGEREKPGAAGQVGGGGDTPVFAPGYGPPVTRVGKYLRRYSFDELPQLFNVWSGQVSLVDPRPLSPMGGEARR